MEAVRPGTRPGNRLPGGSRCRDRGPLYRGVRFPDAPPDSGFSFGGPEYPIFPSKQILPNSQSLHSVIGGVMNDVARQGNCVIVGRGGCEFLRSRRDALHVFLSSDLSSRVRRTRAIIECSAVEAKCSMTRAEAERVAFFRSSFGLKWPPYDSYDMVVNERIAESSIVDLISRFVWTEELGRRSAEA